MRPMLGVVLAWIARAWIATLRFRVNGASVDEGKACVLVFFHGTQMMMHGLQRRGRTCVMVSHSRDGDMQAAALGVLGFDVVRGSSSRGGMRALAAMVRRLREPSTDAVFAVDGPRGPYGVTKPGALLAARRANACVVPAGAAARRKVLLTRAWDRFVLPMPFTRVEIVLGPPVNSSDADACERVSRAIAQCNELAAARAAA